MYWYVNTPSWLSSVNRMDLVVSSRRITFRGNCNFQWVRCSFVVEPFIHCAISCRINPSWWTRWVISHCSQCNGSSDQSLIELFLIAPSAVGRRINPSWWTHWVIFHCSQCSGLSDQSLIVNPLSYFSLLPVQRVVRSIPHGEPIELFLIAASAVGRRINPSWWTHWVISHCNQCSGSSDQSLMVNPLSYFSLLPVQWVVRSIPHSEPIELFLIAASANQKE